jgi:RNA polymerase sigma-70 factor (ECF subfamily)
VRPVLKVEPKKVAAVETQSVAAPDAASGSGGAPAQVVEHFFRHETGRLHGALTRLMGPGNLGLVEDIAQAALLKALRAWSIGGIPPNPSAWITQVAMNLARDTMRHHRMRSSKEDAVVTHTEQMLPASLDSASSATASPDPQEIREDALRLMFVCCHPELAPDAQVVMALKVLCGFNSSEIARAFLRSEAAIEKQLTRTKQRIHDLDIGFTIPEGTELTSRIEGVLAALYLLFNEGHTASSGDQLLREDLCVEAVRLTSILVEHPAGDCPAAHALLALMLLTAGRFPARVDEEGVLLRLDDQDRSKWDQALIGRGLQHLTLAAQGGQITAYHLEAGIAACHCTAEDFASTDWVRILRHYDQLFRLKPSPVVALNRAVAVANVDGPAEGLRAIAMIGDRERLENHYLLHAVIGELEWRQNDHRAAAQSFRRALQLAKVGPEQAHLTRLLARSLEADSADP